MTQDLKDDAEFEAWLVGFNEWAQKCDELLWNWVEMKRDDMGEWLWADAYYEKMTPKEAVESAVRHNMEFMGLDAGNIKYMDDIIV